MRGFNYALILIFLFFITLDVSFIFIAHNSYEKDYKIGKRLFKNIDKVNQKLFFKRIDITEFNHGAYQIYIQPTERMDLIVLQLKRRTRKQFTL